MSFLETDFTGYENYLEWMSLLGGLASDAGPVLMRICGTPCSTEAFAYWATKSQSAVVELAGTSDQEAVPFPDGFPQLLAEIVNTSVSAGESVPETIYRFGMADFEAKRCADMCGFLAFDLANNGGTNRIKLLDGWLALQEQVENEIESLCPQSDDADQLNDRAKIVIWASASEALENELPNWEVSELLEHITRRAQELEMGFDPIPILRGAWKEFANANLGPVAL